MLPALHQSVPNQPSNSHTNPSKQLLSSSQSPSPCPQKPLQQPPPPVHFAESFNKVIMHLTNNQQQYKDRCIYADSKLIV